MSTSIESRAEGIEYEVSDVTSSTVSTPLNTSNYVTSFKKISYSLPFNVSDLDDDTLYKVTLSATSNVSVYLNSAATSLNTSNNPISIRYQTLTLGDVLLKSGSGSGTNKFTMSCTDLEFYILGSELKTNNLYHTYLASAAGSKTFYMKGKLSIDKFIVESLSNDDAEQYEAGFNAGYSAGEQAGEDIGYSNGFEEGFEQGESQGYESGFQAGHDSVDTQSYYDAGYSSGYNAGYSLGYEEGFDKGYSKALKAVQGSAGEWGVEKQLSGSNEKIYGLPFYVTSYGLVDMEEYQSGSNGYFYNTVPGTYKGISEIRYKMPLSSMNGSGACVSDSGCTNIRFFLPNVTLNETIDLGGGQTSGHIISKTLNEVYVTYCGKKYYGVIGSNYVNFDFIIDEPVEQLLFSDSNFQVTFVVEHSLVVVTDSDVTHYIGAKYTPYVSFDSFNFFVKPYYKNDRVSANIQDQTDKITGSLDEQKEIQQGQLEEQKEQTETQKGIASSIKEFFGSFFDNLINSIIHVIVPTKEEMGELFNRLNDFFAETFGFLYYPFDFIIDAFNIFLEADSETGLTLPAFSIMGYEVWGNQTYDITSEPLVGDIFGYVRMGTGAMLAMWFVNYLRNFFDKRFGGGGN